MQHSHVEAFPKFLKVTTAHHLTVPILSHTPITVGLLFTARLPPTCLTKTERPSISCTHCARVAIIEKSKWKQTMNHLLLRYKGTPHTTTNTFLSESLNNRKIKTMLPEMYSTSKHEQKMMVNMMLRRKC